MATQSVNNRAAWVYQQRLLSGRSRAELEDIIEHAIELLDQIDGDPDLEFTGDDVDSDDAEDEFAWTSAALHGLRQQGAYTGAGCPFFDPGGTELGGA